MNVEDKTTKVPNAINKMLLPDEQVLAVVKQSRVKAAITPDSVIITNHRIIKYSPSALGLRKKIEDYRYEDIANLRINKGILFATITLKMRFMSEDLILDNLPAGRADYISKVIQGNLRVTSNALKSPVTASQRGPLTALEDPLQVLKLRFAEERLPRNNILYSFSQGLRRCHYTHMFTSVGRPQPLFSWLPT